MRKLTATAATIAAAAALSFATVAAIDVGAMEPTLAAVSTDSTPLPLPETGPQPADGWIGDLAAASIELIEEVHPIPDGLPPVYFEARDLGSKDGGTTNGRYYFDGFVHTITVNPKSDDPLVTMIHELGHYLDHVAFNQVLGSTGNTLAERLLEKALRRSDTAQDLKACKQDVTHYASDWCDYALEDDELFARAYAHHILEQVGGVTPAAGGGGWTTEDFAPIGPAMGEAIAEDLR